MHLNLDPHFKPIEGQEVPFDSFVFSGGEPHIRLGKFDTSQAVYITHRIQSFNDVGLLLVAVDALQRIGVSTIHLILPYFPAARQDRVMVAGESLSVKVMANLINNLNLASVTILDPHSDVTPALLNNCISISNYSFISKVLSNLPEHFILISPDAGASKKIYKLASKLNLPNVLECGKKRNVATGALTGFSVPVDNLGNKPCLIVDDICDGGGTFLGLGEELKKKQAGDLYLAVSHGIFSKGLSQLSNRYKHIFSTDSFKTIENTNKFTQIKLTPILLT